MPIRRKSFKISYDLALIDKMNGFEFEVFLSELFQKFDYNTTVTKKSGDFGCDVLLEKGNYRIAIQAKCTNLKVGLHAVQEIVASLKKYDAQIGVVIANNKFSKSARQLAKVNDIIMINRNALLRLIDLSKLPKEYRQNLDGFCKQLRITDKRLNLVG